MSFVSRRDLLKSGAALAATQLVPLSAIAVRAFAAEPTKDEPYADAVLIDGEPRKSAKGSYTMVVLPDTQHYTDKFPANYHAQTEWIVANKRDRNIACVLHLGDITNHNAPEEWDVAVAAMKKLDGQVPYFMTVGNHDCGEGGTCADRTTHFNDRFPLALWRERSTFGGTYDRESDRAENSYHLISAGGQDFLILTLEFGPRADVVRWANQVVAQHADRAAILVTHAYMYYDDTRYDWTKYGKDQRWNPHSYKVALNSSDNVLDGEQLWQQLVGKQKNFILTLNGHVLNDGLGRIVTKTSAGRDVNQVLVNFQMRPNGGDGWLRLLEFQADGRTVEVSDYSPVRNQRNESPQNKFTMHIA